MEGNTTHILDLASAFYYRMMGATAHPHSAGGTFEKLAIKRTSSGI